jgi:hypothetical protein
VVCTVWIGQFAPNISDSGENDGCPKFTTKSWADVTGVTPHKKRHGNILGRSYFAPLWFWAYNDRRVALSTVGRWRLGRSLMVAARHSACLVGLLMSRAPAHDQVRF